jgi:hypothetical protein
VDEWRKREGGGRGKRIPDELWAEAVQVALVDGLHATAEATRFNYERLKQRCKAARAAGAVAKADGGGEKRVDVMPGDEASANGSSARFVALAMAAPHRGRQTTVELVGREGERMRVEVAGDVDLVGLVQTFWRRAP